MKVWAKELNNFINYDPKNNGNQIKKVDARVVRAMLRRANILIDNYFDGDERTVLKIICRSALPIIDVAVILGKGQTETYRISHYVIDVLREYAAYFEKKTYKQLQTRIIDFLEPTEIMILHIFAVYRTVQETAKAMGYSHRHTWHVIEAIDGKLKTAAAYDQAIRDLFITWRRVRKIRKSSYYSTQRKKFKKEHL